MTRLSLVVLLMTMTALGVEKPVPVPDQNPNLTFNKDVLPILQDNCQVCHRPGGIGPMSLLTYDNVRPWAKAIKAKVLSKQMPPWFADPRYGAFRNAPKLTDANIETLAAWADNAIEGDSTDKPSQSPQWRDGWRTIPDVVVSMPEAYHVAANGTGEIKEFFIDNPFTEDTWVKSIEIRPGDPSVVHHVIMRVPESTIELPGGRGRIPLLTPSELSRTSASSDVRVDVITTPTRNSAYSGSGLPTFTTMDAVYAPGSQPIDFQYTNSAKLISGRMPIRLEVHYTPNGKDTFDKTKVGFTLAKEPPRRRFVIMAPQNMANQLLPIPSGAGNYETKGDLTFKQDVELAWFMPHMHLRGKDMSFELIYPDGKREMLLKAGFNFHWQLGYELAKPIKVPKGARLRVTAHHDNSRNNRNNPDPKSDVFWGDMTSQEMMIPWFGVIVEGAARPVDIAFYRVGDRPLSNLSSGISVE